MSQAAIQVNDRDTGEETPGPQLRIDEATIALVPHSLASCMDLGLLFCGQNIGRVLKLWLLFAIPCSLLTYYCVFTYDWHLRFAFAVVYFATAIMGVLLVSAAAPAAFGERFTLRRMLALDGLKLGQVLRALGYRVVIACGAGLMFFPPGDNKAFIMLGMLIALFTHWVAARTGFGPEIAYLEALESAPKQKRAYKLVKQHTGTLYPNLLALIAFYVLLVFVLFITVDLGLHTLLQIPILYGQLTMPLQASLFDILEAYVVQGFSLLWNDPLVSATVTAVALFVYPLTRMAWFFIYIDLRVRHDCWDLELLMLEEAKRLESTI